MNPQLSNLLIHFQTFALSTIANHNAQLHIQYLTSLLCDAFQFMAGYYMQFIMFAYFANSPAHTNPSPCIQKCSIIYSGTSINISKVNVGSIGSNRSESETHGLEMHRGWFGECCKKSYLAALFVNFMQVARMHACNSTLCGAGKHLKVNYVLKSS